MEQVNFNQRVEAFNKEIFGLQKKHGVNLYAANVVLKNGEVAPLVRVADAHDKGENDMLVIPEDKTNETKSKKRRAGNKKT